MAAPKDTLDIDQRAPQQRFIMDRMETIFDRSEGKTDHPHRHQYYTVLVVKEGEGEHTIDFAAQPIGPRQVHFVAPGQVHQVKTPVRPLGAVITFTTDFLLLNNIPTSFISDINLFRAFGDHPPLELLAEPFERVWGIVGQMEEQWSQQRPHRDRALGALLQLFLIHCYQHCQLPVADPVQDRQVGILRAFKQLVEGHFRQWHKVREYAEALHLHPRYLSQTIKSLTGDTPKSLIQDRLGLEAKRYLLHTELSIKEIAYRLGYEEPLHFSGFFKKQVGHSPSEFREMGTHG